MRKFLLYIMPALTLTGLLWSCKGDQQVNTVTVEDSEKLSNQIEKELDNPELYYQRAQIYHKEESYDQSILDVQRAIALDSLKPEYYHLLADNLMDYYRSKDALITMVRAAKLFPERIPTLLKLSETQLILKMYEPSLETVARIFSVDPNHPEGHFMMGMNFRGMGETDRAINAFQTVTEMDPENLDAWLFTADLMYEKDLAIAKDYYEAALNLSPDDPSALHSMAFYLQNNGNDAKAIELYKKIVTNDRTYTDAYLNMGILYMSMDSLAVAKEQFNIMAGVSPTNHLPYFYRGLIHEAQGNLDEARRDLQNCINLKDDFDRARKALFRVNESG